MGLESCEDKSSVCFADSASVRKYDAKCLEVINSKHNVIESEVTGNSLWSVNDLWREEPTSTDELLDEMFNKIHTKCTYVVETY